jgi:uncharacterized protein
MDKVVHFEIPTDNIERAQTFYKDVFGWQINKIDMPKSSPYYIVHTVATDADQMPTELGAINVVNLEQSLKKIEEAGGKKIWGPNKVMDMGLYARARDTEGNIVGVWQDLK